MKVSQENCLINDGSRVFYAHDARTGDWVPRAKPGNGTRRSGCPSFELGCYLTTSTKKAPVRVAQRAAVLINAAHATALLPAGRDESIVGALLWPFANQRGCFFGY